MPLLGSARYTIEGEVAAIKGHAQGFNDMMKEEEREEEQSRGRELGRLVLPTYVRPL